MEFRSTSSPVLAPHQNLGPLLPAPPCPSTTGRPSRALFPRETVMSPQQNCSPRAGAPTRGEGWAPTSAPAAESAEGKQGWEPTSQEVGPAHGAPESQGHLWPVTPRLDLRFLIHRVGAAGCYPNARPPPLPVSTQHLASPPGRGVELAARSSKPGSRLTLPAPPTSQGPA